MDIITISREFGSGGRELGKRIADNLGWDYYDREIIDTVAKETGLDADYVNTVLERHEWWTVPVTFQRSFTLSTVSNTELIVKEKEIIERIAKSGRSCVIVGRNADFFLREYQPLRIFVCANLKAKILRCRERADNRQELSDKEIERQIKRIDKSRESMRELVAGDRWGDPKSYHLTVNTTDWELKKLAPVVAEYAKAYFETRVEKE